jgi:hypothetical protein
MEITILSRQNHGTGPWLPVPATIRGTLRSLPGIHSTDGAVVSDQAGQDRSDGPQSWNPQGAQRNVEQSLPIFASASIVFYFGNQKWGWVFNVFQCWGNGINQQDETSHPLDLGQLERSHWMILRITHR